MSLTTDDLNEIRSILESALTRQSSEIIKPIQNELQALRSDIKEIYSMLSDFDPRPLETGAGYLSSGSPFKTAHHLR